MRNQMAYVGGRIDFGTRGAWLLFLYYLSIGTVIVSFSALQLQDKISRTFETQSTSTDPSGTEQVPTLGRLLGLAREFAEMRRDEQALAANREEAREHLNNVEKDTRRVTGELGEATVKLSSLTQQLRTTLDALGGASPSRSEIARGASGETTNEMQDVPAEGETIVASYVRHRGDPLIKELYERYSKQRDTVIDLELREESAEERLGLAQAALDQSEKRVSFLERRRNLFLNLQDSTTAELLNEVLYFENLKRFVFYMDDPYLIITMPNILLTLFVTLSMGALGSTIYVTQSFFQEGNRKPFSWYLFRPFLGMITALAVFVLVKAGQLTVSDVRSAQSVEANLNAYVLAFLAIVSGLLSEQAIQRLSAAGENIFSPSNGAAPKAKAEGAE